ncbi:ecto-ADP-ribosyltransferase 5-like [Paramisgurnus dabryanus]|uniref:ecto-ADP-ribosyltransferase 5-like n=1 Tax=Paramisgurnus dabryanus TaxID=90735 RepID=UPI003CCF39ED
MAEDSVDDRYNDCTEKMKNLVEKKYLQDEITANISGFGTAWINSTKNITGSKDNLKRNHLIAISVYTGVQVYKTFNRDVSTSKQKYKDKTYAWYSLHFWLTSAIQTLKKKQTKCISTYRGTKDRFNENVLNKEIRFGSFASSSLDRAIAKGFGNESCFEINTCHGANVTKYSYLQHEKEVLIPPYEKFNVTAIKKGAWCKTVFVLNSSDIKSNLNCAVASVKPKKYHNAIISD